MASTDGPLSDMELLTDSDTIEYPLDDAGSVTFSLSADPFEDPELTLHSTDEDGQTLTVDRFNEDFLTDPIRREHAAPRIAWTISQEADMDPDAEAVGEVFDAVRDDLASDTVVPVDRPTKSEIEAVSSVTYTPGKERPLTIEHGRERYVRQAQTFYKNLTHLDPQQVGEGSEVPGDLAEGDLNDPIRDTSEQWDRYRRVIFKMAEIGEPPTERKRLNVTDPSDINRLPSTILGGIEFEELVEIIKESEQYSGHPDKSVRNAIIDRGGTRPSNSVLRKFIRELGLADELEDFDA